MSLKKNLKRNNLRKNTIKRNLNSKKKKTIKKSSSGGAPLKLNSPEEAFGSIVSGTQNIFGKLTSLIIGEPPDVRITSIPLTDNQGDQDIVTNMKDESKSAFTGRAGNSQQGLEFKRKMEKIVIDPEKSNDSSTWKYNITPGQLKNFAEKFCLDKNEIFNDKQSPQPGEKKKIDLFNLPKPPNDFFKKTCGPQVLNVDEEESVDSDGETTLVSSKVALKDGTPDVLPDFLNEDKQ
jgi:hypothetical protein